jgi:outer membrane protein assembly factor BamB
MKTTVCLLGAVVVLVGAWAVRAEDWPQWRGPRGDGISQETLPPSLPEGGPKKVWTAKVGMGYASPIAVNQTIYMFGAVDNKEQLTALSAADGKVHWQQGYEGTGTKGVDYQGTRATPTFEDGKLYTLGAAGQATCWDAANGGKILWQVNVLTETGASNLHWGTASSPLIIGDHVYVQGGDGGPVAVGIDKKTGKIDWRAEAKGLSGYAHPVVVDVAGTKQLVVFGGKEAWGIALEGGKTLWQERWKTDWDVNAATPIYRDGYVLFSSGYGHGAMMLKLGPDGAHKEWESKDMASKFQGLILDGDYIYGNSAGRLKCLHWPDGKLVWTAPSDVKLNDGGSLVKAGDEILALSERGKLYLLKVDGAACTKLGEAALFDADQVWATPLLYEGKLYAKAGDELTCYDLNAK